MGKTMGKKYTEESRVRQQVRKMERERVEARVRETERRREVSDESEEGGGWEALQNKRGRETEDIFLRFHEICSCFKSYEAKICVFVVFFSFLIILGFLGY